MDVQAAVTNGFIQQSATVLGTSSYNTGEDTIGIMGAHIDQSYNCDDFENS